MLQSTVSVFSGDSANDGEPYFDAYFLGGGGLQMKFYAIGILSSGKNAGYQPDRIACQRISHKSNEERVQQLREKCNLNPR